MLDIRYFRESFEEVKRSISKKHFACDLDRVRELDCNRIDCLKAFEARESND